MRILLVSDIHANWPALQAVITETYDVCLCLGDLVDYGLEPSPCIAWVKEHARAVVRGNHDHGVAQNVMVNGKVGFKYLSRITRVLTRERLQEAELRYLARLPITRVLTLEDVKFFMVHATPRDPLDEYATADSDFWARRIEHIDADVICVGHTHFPYVLPVGNKVVINPGSVGQPRDGDPRASYAILEVKEARVDLRRKEYPVEDTVRVIQESSLAEPDKQMLIEAFRSAASPLNFKKIKE